VERLANPWRDRRATLSFAIELQAQAAKFLFYVVFFAIVFTYYGMPINIFREVYVSFQQLRRRLIAFNTYRRLTHNMEARFEDIKDEEELDRLGRTCIICRDQMDLLGGCKKLPGCGHAFHTHCLREWLVQQQTCPTCRADIAANEARRKKELERERAAAEREAAEVPVGDANDVTGTDAARPADGAGTNANEPQAQAGGQAEGEPNTAAAGALPEQQPATAPPSDALPDGWTRHVDAQSGRTYYYNKDLGQSSWEHPAANPADETPPVEQRNATNNGDDSANAASTTTSSTDNGMPTNTPRPGFPCLYQITLSTGAPVYSPNLSPSNMYDAPVIPSLERTQRFIPRGKLIVCTAIEYWPTPFDEAMLRMPDGFVRSKDVERFLMIGALPGEVGVDGLERRSEGVAR